MSKKRFYGVYDLDEGDRRGRYASRIKAIQFARKYAKEHGSDSVTVYSFPKGVKLPWAVDEFYTLRSKYGGKRIEWRRKSRASPAAAKRREIRAHERFLKYVPKAVKRTKKKIKKATKELKVLVGLEKRKKPKRRK